MNRLAVICQPQKGVGAINLDYKDFDLLTQSWEISAAFDFLEEYIDFDRMDVEGKVKKFDQPEKG